MRQSTIRGKARPSIRLQAGASFDTALNNLQKKSSTRRMTTFISKGSESFRKLALQLPSIDSEDDWWCSSEED